MDFVLQRLYVEVIVKPNHLRGAQGLVSKVKIYFTELYNHIRFCNEWPFSYPQGPTPRWVCMWMCLHPAFGGRAASRCASRSQISSHTFARRRGTNAHQCNRCSSKCQAECTGSDPMNWPARSCGKLHQTARPHWGENNRDQCVCDQHFIIFISAEYMQKSRYCF